MLSLKNHCLHTIASLNLQVASVIGTGLELNIRMNECKLLCGKTVSKSVLSEECTEYDDNVGWMSGMNSVHQAKHFYQMNYNLWIEYCKKGTYNVGHIPCNYVLHYIKEDIDYVSWVAQNNKCGLHRTKRTNVYAQAPALTV